MIRPPGGHVARWDAGRSPAEPDRDTTATGTKTQKTPDHSRDRGFCGTCRIRTYVGIADGFTVRSHWPLGQRASCCLAGQRRVEYNVPTGAMQIHWSDRVRSVAVWLIRRSMS